VVGKSQPLFRERAPKLLFVVIACFFGSSAALLRAKAADFFLVWQVGSPQISFRSRLDDTTQP
jgi:hypothetical protein